MTLALRVFDVFALYHRLNRLTSALNVGSFDVFALYCFAIIRYH